MPTGDANRIRGYLLRKVEAARRTGTTELTLRAGDVHKALGMENTHANVCQVLEGEKFHAMAGVEFVRYLDRPPSGQGANLVIEFRVLPKPESTEGHRWTA